MELTSFLKFLLADEVSLEQYSLGEFVGFDEVVRRMFLKGREQNRNVPDHYYRLEQSRSFEGISSITDILTVGVGTLADKCLELVGNRIYVKPLMQNEWQELITHIPPLVLQSAFICRKMPFDRLNDNIFQYYDTYLLPNSRYTAIPSPRIQQLDHLVKEQNGLHDLHMHLNGATETDVIWQDYLQRPFEIYHELCKAYQFSKTKEQLGQESPLLNPKRFISLLRVAQKLRSYFYDYLFSSTQRSVKNRSALLNEFIYQFSDRPGSYRHDFISLITDANDYPYLLSIESLMYVLILEELKKGKNEVFAEFFHFYLLILGLANRLLVQQVHQKGFEQFQKHTLNGMRENSELKYKKRFLQMHGNDARNIQFLEGRFSPKDDQVKLINFLQNIDKGWKDMRKELERVQIDDVTSSPKLKLIAHFIKQEDKKPDKMYRHKKLRYAVWQRAKVLSKLLKRHSKFKDQIVAVDAAASEFDAPPEVFAPAFRFLRRQGIRNFTYHAGEDFFHIICGLRAVYEAIVFCGLQPGDRIGHATATGISVKDWHKEVGDQILMYRGEYLDSLVFVYHIIIQCRIDKLNDMIPVITDRVQGLCQKIYKKDLSLPVLEKAWLMRQCCPVHAFHKNREDMELLSVYDPDEWDFITTHKFINDRKTMEGDISWQAYQAYHDRDNRAAFYSIIPVFPFEVLSGLQIEDLQLGLLEFMNRQEIIIETLPTSNVRIGFHRSFNSYHLLNWIDWQKAGERIPPIVVGTDDTGIFATNIYNEYANIYCCLLNKKEFSHSEAAAVIKQLDESSRVYRFE